MATLATSVVPALFCPCLLLNIFKSFHKSKANAHIDSRILVLFPITNMAAPQGLHKKA